MKKIFIALTIALTLIGNLAEAADITDDQIKKIVTEFGQSKIEPFFHMDVNSFRDKFNWYIMPIVQDGLNKDDVFDILHLFELGNYEVSGAESGKIFLGRFEYPCAMIVILSTEDEDHIKSLNLYYTTPEKQDDSVYMSWLLTAFVGSISTEINIRSLMSELTAEGSSGSVVKRGLKFSIAEDGNLNVLSVTAAQ